MKAMVLNELCSVEENRTPLELADLPDPVPSVKEILVKISACGVCHTELDEIEGRTPPLSCSLLQKSEILQVQHPESHRIRGTFLAVKERSRSRFTFSGLARSRRQAGYLLISY